MGKFQPGNKMGQGRPKGSITQRTKEFQEALEAHGFDLPKAMLELYEAGMSIYNENNKDRAQGLAIAKDMTKEIASYILPKLQSTQIIPGSGLEGLSPQEKLAVLKEAVKALEAEVVEKEVPLIEAKK